MSNIYITSRVVSIADCDPGGGVYPPRATEFVVDAVREAMSSWLGAPVSQRLDDLRIQSPVRDLSIEFHRLICVDDEVEIAVRVADVGESSMSFLLEGRRGPGRTLAFRAALTQVCISPLSANPVFVPQLLRDALQR